MRPSTNYCNVLQIVFNSAKRACWFYSVLLISVAPSSFASIIELDAALRTLIEKEEEKIKPQSEETKAYQLRIKKHIESHWLLPSSWTSKFNASCEFLIELEHDGQVRSIVTNDDRCNASEQVRQSLQNALFRASPIPKPLTNPNLFEKEIILRF